MRDVLKDLAGSGGFHQCGVSGQDTETGRGFIKLY